jgi:hypothetical protein
LWLRLGREPAPLCFHVPLSPLHGVRSRRASPCASTAMQVRERLHIVLAFSPIGAAFRTRCRMFPSLVNCCTIDWFNAWPEDALYSVAESFLTKTAGELGRWWVASSRRPFLACSVSVSRFRLRTHLCPVLSCCTHPHGRYFGVGGPPVPHGRQAARQCVRSIRPLPCPATPSELHDPHLLFGAHPAVRWHARGPA